MSVIASMVAVLKAEVEPFAKGMKTAQGALDKFAAGAAKTGAAAVAMGGAIAASVGYAANRFSSFGDEVAKMAKRTGLSTEAVSSLRFAADQSATSIEAIEKAIKRLSVNVTTGSKVFERYGIDLERLKSQSPEQQFNTIADAIRGIEDPTRRLAAAQELLGRAGGELIPLFADGAAGLEAYKQQAQELGLIIGADAAASAEVLNDKMGQLKLQMDALWVAVGQQLAPVLIKMITSIQSVVPPMLEWIGVNQELVVTVAAAGAGLVVFGTAALALSGVLRGLTSAITATVVAFRGLQLAYAVGAGFVALGQAAFIMARGLGIAQTALVAVRVAFIALASSTGIGLIVVAIGSAAGAFLTFTDAGNALVSWIYDKAVKAFEYLGSWVQWFLEKIGLASDEIANLAGQPLPQPQAVPGPAAPQAQAAANKAADIGAVLRGFGANLRQQLFAGNIANKFGDAIANRVEERRKLEQQREQVFEDLGRQVQNVQLPQEPKIFKPVGANSALDAGSAQLARIVNAGKREQAEDAVKKKHFEEARKATQILGKMLDAMNAPDNAGVAFG